jgi:hypothetical protein
MPLPTLVSIYDYCLRKKEERVAAAQPEKRNNSSLKLLLDWGLGRVS